jgi:hypothetical protein
LDLCSQLNNVNWRACPNHEAVSLIAETGLDFGILKAKKALVNHELLVIRGKELFLL